ncbi:heterogeneous nuclear ribonucleoprotein HRP1 [Akanthomyces lecanii RCEF 1005]|uniref:Heterogeneous nuclear ribonucleoprotein HRP1 n=3 Tax=Akanthomyces TaxID=150366 RepID=A0A162KTN9_CORDF|nr:heterogeneous nuclear ribonucleoprotein HRP1 [Akanthomyces lecanii RCEF 1005]
MFIGGLNWETTDQSLRDYFSQFGEVVECTVMRDSNTGRSRGFGFLTFKDAKTVNTVMVKEHYLDGKIIDPKRAIPRDEQEKTSKIFVGGVSQDTTDQEFRDFFAQFGRVIDATLMMDKDTGRPRGFGFVTFESEAGVDACINIPLEIHGKPIEVKRAQPRGNLREEEEAAKRGKFKKADDQSQGMQQMGNSGMTPQVMAQYFQRMQQYFAMMQSQMAMNRGMNMNPAMWQNMMQMQQMQQMMGRGGGGGQGGPNMMNPQMMQQMQQQMQQQQQMMQQQQSQGSPQPQQQGGASPTSQGNGGGSSQGGFENNNFEQFQQQPPQGPGGARRGGRGGFGGGQGGYGGMGGGHQGGNATSWEGMYDDPQPGGYGRGSHDAPPANAPTGPKNPGRGASGGSYRGGGRGGNRGFHPYAR